MDEDTERRPEGQLLYDAMRRQNLSFRGLAGMVALSDARVRNVINGYQAVGQGQRIDIVGPEDTLAKLAMALRVTPDELESAGRSDAARALRRRLPGGPMPEWSQGPGGGGGDEEMWRHIVATHEEIREWAEEPEVFLPPDSILGFFATETLVSELQGRIEMAEREIRPYYWQHNDVQRIPGSEGGDTDGSTNEATEAQKNQFRLAAKKGSKEPDDESQ